MAEKQKEFNDLPSEMFVEVFKYLNIDEIAFRYTEICIHWRENIALHILAPEIIRQAEANPSFKKLLEKNQWTEECEDVEMVIYIYNKTINPITSEFIFGHVLQYSAFGNKRPGTLINFWGKFPPVCSY